ncbi:PEP-CTERM sorting domain-containing protein [Rheinheimera sp. UJ51]|uniref:PEP-CTERM sorting domain-containing protein n=1 Tax=Rheinheimera sp. UJ51 TaxID=2892446 RepID=UPI001E37F554|nr:PEP-CTERM sorting domain-containing protein [Rheinheimera sp. UJ51]MCC5452721.1 PEP-CTERM sorting domain-containing protein [Rheinheimera sp. UJ51]
MKNLIIVILSLVCGSANAALIVDTGEGSTQVPAPSTFALFGLSLLALRQFQNRQ